MRKKVRRRRRKYTRPSFGSAADFYVIRFKSFFRITSGSVTGSQQGPEPARFAEFPFSIFARGGMATLLQNQYSFILNSAGCCDTPPPADSVTKPPALIGVLVGITSWPQNRPGTLSELREFYGILRNFTEFRGPKIKFHADEN